MAHSSWDMLPEEIIAATAAKLEGTVAAARLISKRWAAAAPRAVKSLSVKGAIPGGSFFPNLSGLENFTGVESLELSQICTSDYGFSLEIDDMLGNGDEFGPAGPYMSPLASLTSPKSLALIIGHSLRDGYEHKTIHGLKTLSAITSPITQDPHMSLSPGGLIMLIRLETLYLPQRWHIRVLKPLHKLPRPTVWRKTRR
jgi:hypothetical protein